MKFWLIRKEKDFLQMITSTTEEPLINSTEPPTEPRARAFPTLSTLSPDEFNQYIREEYGAGWGTLKFQDTLSDYSNKVISFIFLVSSSLSILLGTTIYLC